MWSKASSAVRRVLVTHREIPQKAIDLLKKRFKIEFVDGDPPLQPQIIETAKTVAKKPGGITAILWWSKGSHVRLDEEVLQAAGPNLRFISGISAGQDMVDNEAIRKRGIALGFARYCGDAAVADVAIGLLISASRRFREGRRATEAGLDETAGPYFSPMWMLGQDLTGSTVGIIGLGGIGSAIAKRLKGFDISKMVYSGHSDKPIAKELGADKVPLTELLEISDFVIAACPLTPETTGLINAGAFRRMKKTATFVNVARGQIVDQDALIHALKTGEIFAAGLDTVTPEPLPKDHPLLKLPNAEVLPHIGSGTHKSRECMAVLAAENILAAIDGKPMPCPAIF